MTATDDFIRELRADCDHMKEMGTAYGVTDEVSVRQATLRLLLDIVAAATGVDSTTHRHMPPEVCLDCDCLSRNLDALEAHLKERAK